MVRDLIGDMWESENWLPHIEDELRMQQTFEHVVEGCQCEGKQCSQCQYVKCKGMFSPNGKYLRSNCKSCKQESDRMRWHENAETINERRREQRPLNAEKINAQTRASRRVHGYKYNAQMSAKIASDPEYAEKRRNISRNAHKKYGHVYNARKRTPAYRERARVREWRIRNKDQETRQFYNQRVRTYRKEYPERFAAYDAANHHKRRAHKAQAGGSFTAREWIALKAEYNCTCLCCGRREPEIKLTADHIIPLVKGGSSSIENIQPLCVSCNSRKRDKIIDYRRKDNQS